MFKSIFTRLLTTYLLLILLLTTALASLLSYGFNRYVFAQKNQVLDAAADKVEILINSRNQGEIKDHELQIALDNLGYMSDSIIYVLKVDSTTLDNFHNQQLEAELAEGYLLDDLRAILQGRSIYRKKQFSQILDTNVVFMGTPLRINNEITGAVLIFSPLGKITTYLAKMNAMIGGIALAAMIFSIIFISITAARITRPIRDMEHAARKLAAGEQTPDLLINTGDEVEGLAHSFNYMKGQVEATEKMRREFIANVSHELRTPLTSIHGFVQGMLDGLVSPDQYPRYLGLIQEETRRLMRLTGDILELAKLQSGHISLNKELLCACAMVEKVSDSFIIPCRRKGITLHIDCDPHLQVWADSDRLQQILHNIISNAMQHTEAGGSIRIQAQEQKDQLKFTICDTGTGISPENLSRIFERFYRDQNSQGKAGTGLGLSIVKNLVELHGGSVCAESQPGQGTCIIFYLPQR